MIETCALNMTSYCCDESLCCLNFAHLPFQCACNDNETLASYAKETMIFMMWNKLKNLLLGRVPLKLVACLKMLMMLLIELKVLLY